MANSNGKSSAANSMLDKTNTHTERGINHRTVGKGGLDAAEQAESNLERAQEVIKECSQELFMMIYDIPTNKNDVCPNPSGLLWRYGFRLNLSCWVMPKSSLEREAVVDLMEHWRSHSIRTYLIPYSDKARDQIKAIAREKLTEEVQRIGASLLQRIGDAHKRYDAASKALDKRKEEGKLPATAYHYQEEQYRRELNVKAALSSSEKALTNAVECMRLFEEEENLSALVEGVRETLKAEKANYEAMKAAQIKG